MTKRVVLKIGSALAVDKATGGLRQPWFQTLAHDVFFLHRQLGIETVIVASGAVALGRRLAKLPTNRALRTAEKRIAAAAGQAILMQGYSAIFAPYGIGTAQLLLTLNDTETRQQYLNARNTLDGLLASGVLPIINENDAVAITAFKYGDNDRLAARVAAMIGADTLILLSDIDGLYTADPSRDPSATHIASVADITPAIEAMAGGVTSGVGSGGMATKIAAAKIAVQAGCSMIIADGRPLHALRNLSENARHTQFVAAVCPHTARKQWILGSLQPSGTLHIDAGAARALHQGKSLLAAGVTAVQGAFKRGDCVEVRTNGAIVARGLSSYDHDDATRIMGQRSANIAAVLGVDRDEPLIHRDDLALCPST